MEIRYSGQISSKLRELIAPSGETRVERGFFPQRLAQWIVGLRSEAVMLVPPPGWAEHPPQQLLRHHLRELVGVAEQPFSQVCGTIDLRPVIHLGRRIDGLTLVERTPRGDAVEVLYTPGHTPGSCSFFARNHNLLLAGDTLFAGSVGRTDLWGGDFDTEIRSIRERLLPLPDKTRVIAGHGPDTTIVEERETNPFLTR